MTLKWRFPACIDLFCVLGATCCCRVAVRFDVVFFDGTQFVVDVVVAVVVYFEC